MPFSNIDLSQLPPPEIVETLDYEAILARLVTDFIQRWPDYDVHALESDPAKKLLEVAAYREMVLRARINEAARANLLAFAKGGDLDQLAVFYEVTRLPGEEDARFRRRVVLAIAGRSTGGTAERYAYIAMSADVRIADAVVWVSATSPLVRVSILNSFNNGIPYPEMLTAVREALNAPGAKMVNDTLAIEGAVRQIVNVAANVWLLPSAPQAVFDALEQDLRDAWGREGGLGRDLSVAWITARLMRPGVARVHVTSPANGAVAQFHESIALGAITLIDRGREF